MACDAAGKRRKRPWAQHVQVPRRGPWWAHLGREPTRQREHVLLHVAARLHGRTLAFRRVAQRRRASADLVGSVVIPASTCSALIVGGPDDEGRTVDDWIHAKLALRRELADLGRRLRHAPATTHREASRSSLERPILA